MDLSCFVFSGFHCGQSMSQWRAGEWTPESDRPGWNPSIATYLGCVTVGKSSIPENLIGKLRQQCGYVSPTHL